MDEEVVTERQLGGSRKGEGGKGLEGGREGWREARGRRGVWREGDERKGERKTEGEGKEVGWKSVLSQMSELEKGTRDANRTMNIVKEGIILRERERAGGGGVKEEKVEVISM